MQKNFLIALSLLCITMFAQADVLINQSNKASPATILAKTYEKSLNDNQIDFFQANSCEEAQSKFDSSKNAVMIYNSDVGIAALSKNLTCPFTAKATQTIFIARSYTEICSSVAKPTSIETSNTIGMASVIYSPQLINDYNSNGLHLKGVPYGGSKDVLNALLAGDIDLGIIGKGIADSAVKEGKISCGLSTDPKSSNFVGKKLKLKMAALPIIQIFYTNSNDSTFITKLQKATDDPDFQKFLKLNGYNDIKNSGITERDVADVRQHILDRYNAYWK